MKRFQLNALTSDILISIYVIVTLFIRFKFENDFATSALESLVMGVCFVLLIWVPIKLKLLNPNWFGLFNSKTSKP